jgi:hypothetical protein
VRGRDKRLISAEGNDIYVRRFDGSGSGARYSIYHVGDELRDPDDGDVLGYQGLFTGEADFKQAGDPATLLVIMSARETTEGDILLPATPEAKTNFIPHAPAKAVNGSILSVSTDHQRTVTGEYDVVVINRGSSQGLQPGNVLAIWEPGEEVLDKAEHAVSRKAQLPDERIGLCMIFKTYDRLSFALTLKASREVRVGDMVRSP